MLSSWPRQLCRTKTQHNAGACLEQVCEPLRNGLYQSQCGLNVIVVRGRLALRSLQQSVPRGYSRAAGQGLHGTSPRTHPCHASCRVSCPSLCSASALRLRLPRPLPPSAPPLPLHLPLHLPLPLPSQPPPPPRPPPPHTNMYWAQVTWAAATPPPKPRGLRQRSAGPHSATLALNMGSVRRQQRCSPQYRGAFPTHYKCLSYLPFPPPLPVPLPLQRQATPWPWRVGTGSRSGSWQQLEPSACPTVWRQ